MSDVIRGAVALFAPLAEDGGVALNCQTQDDLTVQGDLRMLQRAMANLVDNAIKYTQARGSVDIRGYRDMTDAGKVKVSVSDNGIGITPDDLGKVFDRFYRCDQSRATGGSGLGLSLVKSIALAHQGDIRVESTPGKGSVFTLVLPGGKAAETTGGSYTTP
jgi:signal transduction histidine kinase